VIGERDSQHEKHPEPIISPFLAIKIDWSDEKENANDLICAESEFDLHVIDESDVS
jgi:hypothetical protein